jgi:serine/threonine protein kinase
VFTSAPASHLGTLIDRRYCLQRAIGEGASSWVYAAKDLRLDREVALKLFKPAPAEHDLKRRKAWIAEGRTLAKLVHPHIVAIHDASEDGAGQSYLVMELCEAGTLETELAQLGTLDTLETLKLVLPLMGALAVAHDRDVVHRDIKPGNIVVVQEREERRCKLLDFGISVGAAAGTSSDLMLGTPSYMAPEQVRGEPPTPATDVWALGVVLYRCLTGQLPFQASSEAALLHKITRERAPRLATVAAHKVPARLALVLDRALERTVERRYRDVRSFAQAIAVACALDQLPLSPRPEPIGLPLFERWFRDAQTIECTRDLDSPLEPSHVRAEHARRAVRQIRRPVLAAAICAVVGASGLFAFTPRVHSGRVEISRPSSQAGQRGTPIVGAREVATLPSSLPSSQTEQPLPARAEVDPSEAPSTPKPKKPRSLRAQERLGASAAPAQQPLIKDWDWQ